MRMLLENSPAAPQGVLLPLGMPVYLASWEAIHMPFVGRTPDGAGESEMGPQGQRL